jgi:hypothetical protein
METTGKCEPQKLKKKNIESGKESLSGYTQHHREKRFFFMSNETMLRVFIGPTRFHRRPTDKHKDSSVTNGQT